MSSDYLKIIFHCLTFPFFKLTTYAEVSDSQKYCEEKRIYPIAHGLEYMHIIGE